MTSSVETRISCIRDGEFVDGLFNPLPSSTGGSNFPDRKVFSFIMDATFQPETWNLTYDT
jgi:hypothetical protein